jgi:hypothetical protein
LRQIQYTLKKLIILILLFLVAHEGYAYDRYSKYRAIRGKYRYYNQALTLNSPLSSTFKLGGGVEKRFRSVSYMASYWKYKGGVYPGDQENLEIRYYLPRWKSFQPNFEWFLYARLVAGVAGYDGTKLKMFGYDHDIVLPPYLYGGGGMGFGRRYHFDYFFLGWKAGVKYVVIDGLEEENKNLFRLFYTTGPGSIVDVNFQFGLQL